MNAVCLIHTDGGARGNPGPAAAGGVVEITLSDDSGRGGQKKKIFFKRYLGNTTNNIAEYHGVIEAYHVMETLQHEHDVSRWDITFKLDSQLVVNQLNGTFKVKNAALREKLLEIRTLEQTFPGKAVYIAVPREQNAEADRMVNESLDEHLYS